ncbi:MAG: hypothetical protein KJZ93_28520 [Caldilineaceae bacterium]|nr:hypothetical protein [Caldilineaceae bacterium]
MSNKRAFLPLMIVVLVLAALLGPMVLAPVPDVQAAPAAAPTPITQYPRNPAPRVANFWQAPTALTADARTCVNVDGFNVLDLHYIIDQGTVNTTTVTLQFSNIDGAYVSGPAVVSANTADTADMKQFQVYGRWACLHVDVSNSNPWTITAVGLVK